MIDSAASSNNAADERRGKYGRRSQLNAVLGRPKASVRDRNSLKAGMATGKWIVAIACLCPQCGADVRDELPQAVQFSEAGALRRGSQAPQLETLRRAVTDYWLARIESLPSTVGRDVCLNIVAQPDPEEWLKPPVYLLDQLQSVVLRRLRGGGALQAGACTFGSDSPDPVMLNVGPVRHWWDDSNEFQIEVWVGPLDNVEMHQRHAAVRRSGSWVVKEPQPVPGGGICTP